MFRYNEISFFDGTICGKGVFLTVNGKGARLKNSIFVQIIAFFVELDPATLHDTIFAEIISVSVSIGEPASVVFSVYKKFPV